MNTTVVLPRFRTVVAAVMRRLLNTVADRVIVTLVIAVAVLAVLDSNQAWGSLDFTLRSFAGILPFLVVAVSLAAMSRATGADHLIAGAFGGRAAKAVPIASVAGALSPFCSCGVVPVIASLLRAGVPPAPVMAFWFSF
ncbi:MAG: permease [Arenicellales bacterium]|jgi:hypothetical protein